MKKIIISLITLFALFLPPTPVSEAGFGAVPEFKAPGVLVEYLSTRYKQPSEEIAKIVRYAYHIGHPSEFPTPLDILAIIGVESSFKASARGPGGQGLMQVNPSVWKQSGLDLNHPYENMIKGVEILSYYKTLAKNNIRALVYYNLGPRRGNSACEELGSCKTEYVLKVSRLKQQLAKFASKELTCLLY